MNHFISNFHLWDGNCSYRECGLESRCFTIYMGSGRLYGGSVAVTVLDIQIIIQKKTSSCLLRMRRNICQKKATLKRRDNRTLPHLRPSGGGRRRRQRASGNSSGEPRVVGRRAAAGGGDGSGKRGGGIHQRHILFVHSVFGQP